MGAMAAGLIAENTSNRVIFGLSSLPIVAMLLVLLVALNKDRKS